MINTTIQNTNQTVKSTVSNQHVKDSGAKLIFKDPILCAEFLRGYVDIELLKDVQPEDIEDISERFVSMWQEERDSDSVKKIRIKDTSLFTKLSRNVFTKESQKQRTLNIHP